MWKQLLLLAALVIILLPLLFFTKYGSARRLTASVGTVTSATSSDATTTAPTLVDILQQLEDQQQSIVDQLADARAEIDLLKLENIFTRDLKRGDSGDDVRELQQLLADISGNASSTVSGFYGHLTETSVAEFQSEEGLKKTGIADRTTRNKLFESAKSLYTDESTSTQLTVIDLSSLAAQPDTVDLQNQISDLTSQLTDMQTVVTGLQDQLSQLSSTLSGGGDNTANAAPAPTPPSSASMPQPLAISAIVSTTTKTSSVISWVTNNPATSEVYYSQNSSFEASQTHIINNSSMTTSHAQTLSNLNSGTTYYYRVVSKDSTGSTATSSNLVFTTQH